MNNNRNSLIYLAGPIESAKDFGHNWRNRVDRRLRELGYNVYNPASDELQILEPYGLKDAAELQALKKEMTTLGRFREVMKGIIVYDLDKLQKAACIIVLLNQTFSGGTAGEITVMRWLHNKPVYAIVAPTDIPSISGWMLSCVTHFFKDEETLLDYVAKYGF